MADNISMKRCYLRLSFPLFLLSFSKIIHYVGSRNIRNDAQGKVRAFLFLSLLSLLLSTPPFIYIFIYFVCLFGVSIFFYIYITNKQTAFKLVQ